MNSNKNYLFNWFWRIMMYLNSEADKLISENLIWLKFPLIKKSRNLKVSNFLFLCSIFEFLRFFLKKNKDLD